MSEVVDPQVGSSIQRAIDDLDALFGARPRVPAKPLVDLYISGELDALLARIAAYMSLPVRFKLSVASEQTPFRSRHLARTDRSGRGIEGIEAQVSIPAGLPLFGSAELTRYPISVLVTPAFATSPKPETAIAILAHELSHVLLHALRHPERESEVVTDLVPLVLGFGDIVERGRLLSWDTQNGNVTRTTTITYGYLSDGEFASALRRTQSKLRERQGQVRRLRHDVARCFRLTKRATVALSQFAELKQHVDKHVGRVQPSDAERIVALHAADATSEIEHAIRRASAIVAKLKPLVRGSHDYLKVPVTLHEHQRELSSAQQLLQTAFPRLRDNLALLARNCGWRYQIKHWLTAGIGR